MWRIESHEIGINLPVSLAANDNPRAEKNVVGFEIWEGHQERSLSTFVAFPGKRRTDFGICFLNRAGNPVEVFVHNYIVPYPACPVKWTGFSSTGVRGVYTLRRSKMF